MFQGKHILITGATRGIGKALLIQLMKLGAHVSGMDVMEEELLTTQEELNNLEGKSFLKAIDITDKTACKQFIWEATQRLGPVYGVVNCAGITHIEKAESTPLEKYEQVIQINLLGTITVTQLCLADLISQKGFVVGIASIAGYSPLYYRTAYAASKHGVMGYLNSLGTELKENQVNVMRVCPGYVATKLQENQGNFDNRTGESMTPAFVANEIVEGITANKSLLLIGSTAKKAYWVNKLFPRFYKWIMVKKTR